MERYVDRKSSIVLLIVDYTLDRIFFSLCENLFCWKILVSVFLSPMIFLFWLILYFFFIISHIREHLNRKKIDKLRDEEHKTWAFTYSYVHFIYRILTCALTINNLLTIFTSFFFIYFYFACILILGYFSFL